MQQAAQQIQRIQQKVQQLLKRQQALQKQNQELNQQLQGMKKQRDQQLVTIEELQQNIEVLKAVRSALSQDEKKAFEKRLSQYIKEIDRCIAMLSE